MKNDDLDNSTVIADMSGVERRPLIIPRLPRRNHSGSSGVPDSGSSADGSLMTGDRNSSVSGGTHSSAEAAAESFIGNAPKLSKEDIAEMKNVRGAAMRGAVAAGLLIAGVLIVGLGIVVLIILAIGK